MSGDDPVEARYRIGGVLCLLAAAGVAWLGIVQPLQQASAGAEVVGWAPRTAVVVALAAVFGIYFLVTGNRYPYRDVERQTLTPVGWMLFTAIAVTSLAGYFGIATALRSLGYQ